MGHDVPAPLRVGAIDIGTNSVLLLVAERRNGQLVALRDTATITRLGQGVDRSGRLDEEAMTRTLACLDGHGRALRELGVEHVDAVATSAMRDARGAEGFLDEAERRIGCRPRVISGQREAELTFAGALSGLPISGPVAVFDLGGGSTEIIAGRLEDGRCSLDQAVSLDIGAVRLRERHLASDPPSASELAALRHAVRSALREAPAVAGRPLVGVAGTVTTLAAVAVGASTYDADTIHGMRLSRQRLAELTATLATMPPDQRRALAGMEAGRADVIVSGAAIVDEICSLAGADELWISARGVRWGLATKLADLREA